MLPCMSACVCGFMRVKPHTCVVQGHMRATAGGWREQRSLHMRVVTVQLSQSHRATQGTPAISYGSPSPALPPSIPPSPLIFSHLLPLPLLVVAFLLSPHPPSLSSPSFLPLPSTLSPPYNPTQLPVPPPLYLPNAPPLPLMPAPVLSCPVHPSPAFSCACLA